MKSEEHSIGIQHQEADGRGSFFLARDGIQLAEMTYSRASERRVIIDHTLVDEQLRGLGVARRLLDTAVAWARATDTRILATCPYALAQFERDPTIRDVLDQQP